MLVRRYIYTEKYDLFYNDFSTEHSDKLFWISKQQSDDIELNIILMLA